MDAIGHTNHHRPGHRHRRQDQPENACFGFCHGQWGSSRPSRNQQITAIPELLKLLDIHGCLIATDALGCQSDIAADIVVRGGEYLLAVKGNQGLLFQDIKACFADESLERDTNTSENKGHGRIEKRTCEVMSGPDIIARLRHKNNWVDLNTIVNEKQPSKRRDD